MLDSVHFGHKVCYDFVFMFYNLKYVLNSLKVHILFNQIFLFSKIYEMFIDLTSRSCFIDKYL